MLTSIAKKATVCCDPKISYARPSEPPLSYVHLALRGASTGDVRMMEQAEGGAGDVASHLPGGSEAIRCAAPALRPRQPETGRPGAPLGGQYDPPARSWLIRRRKCHWKAWPGTEKLPLFGAPRGGASHQDAATPRKRGDCLVRLAALRSPLWRGECGSGAARAPRQAGGDACALSFPSP
jgi:hypothetical protein